jgi:DNA-binding CsgD family transcriptional regulator/PAS domain-containing protein
MRNPVSPDLPDLLSSLYGGIEAEPPWQEFLAALAQWLEADYATLILAAKDRANPGTFLSPGADPARIAEYLEQFFASDPFRNLANDTVTSFAEFLAGQDSSLHAEYRAFLAEAGGEQVLAVDMRFPSLFEARVRVTRAHGRPAFTREERNRLQAIVPHLRNAVRLFEQLHFASAERDVFRSAIDALGLALVVLDRQMQVVSANTLGRRILDEGEGIFRSSGRVQFRSGQGASRISDLIQTGRGQMTVRFRLDRPDHGDLIVTARSLDLSAIHSGAGALALFLSPAENESRFEPETIRQLLGVTPAEARLCAELATGKSLGDAAVELRISRNTAKVQLRSIFVKTQVNRQAQLINLLSSLRG